MKSSTTNKKVNRFDRGVEWSEVSLLIGGSFMAIAVFSYLPLLVPWLNPYAAALIAAAFIYLPALAVWRRQQALSQIGVVFPTAGTALVMLMVLVVVFPLFSGAFFAYHRVFNRYQPCLKTTRLVDWPEALYSPVNPALQPESLVLFQDEQDRLRLYNNSKRQQTVTLSWEPKAAELIRCQTDDEGSLYPRERITRPGELSLQDQESLLFVTPDGPAELTIEAIAGVSFLRVGPEEEDLPFQTERGWGWLLSMLFVQLVLIALPEELFYRGYLQTSLQHLLKVRWKVFGGDVGPAVILTSALFALGHLIAIPSADRLAVFFPSLLFGWLRDRTGSIFWPVLLHALSNVLLEVLQHMLCQ
jgi:hypothetical protein